MGTETDNIRAKADAIKTLCDEIITEADNLDNTGNPPPP